MTVINEDKTKRVILSETKPIILGEFSFTNNGEENAKEEPTRLDH